MCWYATPVIVCCTTTLTAAACNPIEIGCDTYTMLQFHLTIWLFLLYTSNADEAVSTRIDVYSDTGLIVGMCACDNNAYRFVRNSIRHSYATGRSSSICYIRQLITSPFGIVQRWIYLQYSANWHSEKIHIVNVLSDIHIPISWHQSD